MAETTQPPRSLTESEEEVSMGDVDALVLIWSRDEPARVGEVLLVPPRGTWIFGRDGAKAEGRASPLGLVRQRPGVDEPTGPLACPRISRAQLRLEAAPAHGVRIENVGRCALVHAGREVARADLAPGDVVELRHEIVLLCARRPRVMPALSAAYPTDLHAFGAPDAFGIVGESPALWDLRRAVAAVARRTVHVLVLGPSGSGKELVARALHAQSPRKRGPLVARNAATIPASVFDAELFGHAKNFPNAGAPERLGLIGEANGGTLFLDEIAELPTSQQAHLLRVLDDGEYHRLGESRARRADLRLVAATNRPMDALKHDVLARLEARLVVPALDARREDVPLLAAHLLRRQAAGDPSMLERFFADGDPASPPRLSPDLVIALVQHRYATNTRELDALLLRASLESRGRYVDLTDGARLALSNTSPRVEHVAIASAGFTPEEQRRLAIHRRHRFKASDCGRDPEYRANRQTADLHMRQLMSKALASTQWDVRAAAAMLAGGDTTLADALAGRVETFLFNLRRRLRDEGGEALRRALAKEWRGNAASVLEVLDAIEGARIRGASKNESEADIKQG